MPSYDEDLTNLEESIRRLKVEYDIFFNGNRKKPPDDLRMRVERLAKRLAETTDMNFAQRFRYNTLFGRFCIYRDLWRRTQLHAESATETQDPQVQSKGTPPADTAAGAPIAEVQVSISDPVAEAEKVQQLYDQVLRMRGRGRDHPGISYQQFAEYVANQTRGIKNKCQCTSVTFRVSLEEKAIKFTAKADGSSSG